MGNKANKLLSGNAKMAFTKKLFFVFGILILLLFWISGTFFLKSNQDMEKVEKIDSLIRLGRDLAFIEKSTSADLATEALIESLEINYRKGQADAYRLNSIVTYMGKDYLTSIEYLELSIELFKEMNDSIGLADADISYGHIYRDLNQLNRSEFYFKKAYEFFKRNNYPDRLSVAEYNYANILFENGKSQKSQEILDFLSKHEDFNKNKSLYIFYLNLRAKNLIYLKLYDSALDYLFLANQESLSLKENRNKTAFIETLFYTGKVYYYLNKFDSSEFYLSQAKNDPYISIVENYSDSVFTDLINLSIIKNDVSQVKDDVKKYLEFKSIVKLKNLFENNDFKFNVVNNKHLIKDNIDLRHQQYLSSLYNRIYLFVIIGILISFLIFLYLKFKKDQLSSIVDYQKRRYVKLFENSPLSILIVNEDGDVIISNGRAKQFEDSYGKKIFSSLINSVLNKSSLKYDGGFEGNDFFEFERGDLYMKVYFIYDSSSVKKEYTILFEDFTALKKSLNEQENLNELLNQSYEVANIGSFSLKINENLDFEIEMISDNAAVILGFSVGQENSGNYNIWDLFDFEDSIESHKRILKALYEDDYFDSILKLNSNPFPNRWVRIVGKVSGPSDSNRYIKGILQDVTSERRLMISTLENLQKEKELNLVKSKFISMTSHEFRTPISVASSSIDMMEMYLSSLENSDIKKKILHHSSKISNQLNKIVLLLDDILILERTSLTDKTLNVQVIFLDEFLGRIVEEINSTLTGRKVQLLMSGENFEFITDAVLFEYLINNLVSNAIKFSGNDSDCLIEVEFNEKVKIIKVTDFGIGVPEDEIPHIFNTFFRASNSKSVKGTGLGLSIVNEICKKFNFRIEVDSVVNHKTTFILNIGENSFTLD
jgi:signal transduction histidine kinase